MDTFIKLTAAAVRAIKADAGNKGISLREVYLRVGISSAACCGFLYLLEFTREKAPDDHELEISGIKVLVDNKSRPHLEGAEIDYVTAGDLLAAGFTFRNPNAPPACGCGKTHSPDEEK